MFQENPEIDFLDHGKCKVLKNEKWKNCVVCGLCLKIEHKNQTAAKHSIYSTMPSEYQKTGPESKTSGKQQFVPFKVIFSIRLDMLS